MSPSGLSWNACPSSDWAYSLFPKLRPMEHFVRGTGICSSRSCSLEYRKCRPSLYGDSFSPNSQFFIYSVGAATFESLSSHQLQEICSNYSGLGHVRGWGWRLAQHQTSHWVGAGVLSNFVTIFQRILLLDPCSFTLPFFFHCTVGLLMACACVLWQAEIEGNLKLTGETC